MRKATPVVEGEKVHKKTLSEAKKDAEDAKAELKQVQETHDAKAQEAAAAQDTLSKSEKDVEAAKAAVAAKQAVADQSLEAAKSAAQEATKAASAKVDSAQKDLAAAEKRVSDAQAAEDAAQKALDKAQSALDEARANAADAAGLEKAEAERDKAQVAKEQAEKALSDKQTELDKAQERHAAAEAELQAAQSAQQEADAKLREAQNELDKANTAVFEAEAKQKELDGGKYQTLLDEAKQKLQEKETAFNEAQKLAETKASELAEAEKNLESKRQELTTKEAALSEARREKDTLCATADAKKKLADEAQAAKLAAEQELAKVTQALEEARAKKAEAQAQLPNLQRDRDAAKAQNDTIRDDIARYEGRGSLGMIDWLHSQQDIRPEVKTDLEKARSFLERGLNENVSAWAPSLKDKTGAPMQGLDANGGKTASLKNERDALSLKNTLSVLDFFTVIEEYAASDDPFRKVILKSLEKAGKVDVTNGSPAKISFSILASAQLNADRNSFYGGDNLKFISEGATKQALGASGVPATDVAQWLSEKKYFEAALKELGFDLDTLEYDERVQSNWEKLRFRADEIAEREGATAGHYNTLLHSHAGNVLAYGTVQALPGQTNAFATNGTAHAKEGGAGDLTFAEMRALIKRYTDFLKSAPEVEAAYNAAEKKLTDVQNTLKQATTDFDTANAALPQKQQDAQRLTAAAEEANRELTSAKDACSAKENTLPGLEEAATKARQDATAAEKTKTEAATQKAAQDKVLEQARTDLKTAQDELAALKDKDQALAEAAEKVAKAKKAQGEAAKKAGEAAEALTKAQDAVAPAADAVREATEQRKQAQDTLNGATNTLKKAEEDLAPLAEANKDLVSARKAHQEAEAKKTSASEELTAAKNAQPGFAQALQDAQAAKGAAQAKQEAFDRLTAEEGAKGFDAALLKAYPELQAIVAHYDAVKEAQKVLGEAQAKAEKAKEAHDVAAAALAEAKKNLDAAKAKADAAEAEYQRLLIVTPKAPEFVNPSAADPAGCSVQPYATITETAGVAYTVTVDGKAIQADANGKYVYPYGKTIVVKAMTVDGIRLAEGAQSEWTWTAMQAESCTNMVEKKPQAGGKIAATGMSANSAAAVAALLGAGAGLVALGRANRKRFNG